MIEIKKGLDNKLFRAGSAAKTKLANYLKNGIFERMQNDVEYNPPGYVTTRSIGSHKSTLSQDIINLRKYDHQLKENLIEKEK